MQTIGVTQCKDGCWSDWMGGWTVSAVRQGHMVGWFEDADFRVGEVVSCDDIKCGWGGGVVVSRWVE